MEPDDPPPKTYGFKEREFKRDNARPSEAAPMPTAKDLAKMAGPVTPSPKGATGPKAGDPNDVYNALLKNRAVEQALGLDQIEIRKIKRRKMRDYCLIMVPTMVLLGTVTILGRGNPIVFVCGLAGMVMLGIMITWIMWQLMDRY
ncbi:MAG TPA: hypothetical protein VGD97_16560 [Lacunisphaera sp.]